jgi:hypothetical protein
VELHRKNPGMKGTVNVDKGRKMSIPVRYVGCCGAYCRTCRALAEGSCKGCKLGYDEGVRVIDHARCAMKLCCFRDRNYETCADCPDFATCTIISGFFVKNGYKYRKYQQSLEFISKHGYPEFLRRSERWKGPYGKLE